MSEDEGRAVVGCLFKLSEAADAMGGHLVGRDWKVGNVVTDNREVNGGSLFFALHGARADGHDFLRDVFRRGAAGAVVARQRIVPDGPCIEVDDPAQALGKLAHWHRMRMPAKVVGITGSTGKTGTKELTVAALSTVTSVHKSEGNLNTEIGLPLALFDLCPSHMVSVLEMGMRGPGQIAELCDMTKPSIGVITNIGMSHIGELGSREAIAAAKGELLYALPPDGAAILNASDQFTEQLSVTVPCPVITFGPGGDVEVVDIQLGDEALTVTYLAFGRRVTGEIRSIGTFQAINGAAALAVAGAMSVDVETAAAGLRDAVFPPGRMQLLTLGGVKVLADMYNASPDSTAGALRTLAAMPAKRRVAVLGSMLELGEFSRTEHERIGELVAQLGIDELGVVGREAAWIAEAAAVASTPMERATRLENTEAAAEWLPRFVQDGDLILIKGSRALHMESILDALGAGVS